MPILVLGLNHRTAPVVLRERFAFTEAQIQRLTALVETLRREFNIPADRVLLHSEIASVDDPGRLFPAHVLQTGLAAASVSP